jgi:hypothetical protein
LPVEIVDELLGPGGHSERLDEVEEENKRMIRAGAVREVGGDES